MTAASDHTAAVLIKIDIFTQKFNMTVFAVSQWPSGNMPDCGVRGPRNLTAGGCVYHDSHCDIQPWARAAHPYCSA